jgi:hypothetical protein
VGAPKADGTSDVDLGALYILTVNPNTGAIIQSFKLQNFNGVPYYTGGSITNFLGNIYLYIVNMYIYYSYRPMYVLRAHHCLYLYLRLLPSFHI